MIKPLAWIEDFPASLPGRNSLGLATGGGARLAPGSSPVPFQGFKVVGKRYGRWPARGAFGEFGRPFA